MEKHKIDIQPNILIKVPIISVIGGPGCGKGTLCQLLSKHYNLFHISVGDLLREETNTKSQYSNQITQSMKVGKNVDVDVLLHMLENKMLQNTSHNGYLLDGFPRDAKHGTKFEEKIAPISCVLFLQASLTTLRNRLIKRSKNSDRIDDNAVTIEKRLSVYLALEPDVLKKYASKIRKISCEKSIKEVFNTTITVLNEYFVSK